jgi:hypothetical protein
MFGKRSFIVKVAKDKDLGIDSAESDSASANPFENVEVMAAYSEVAKDFITHAALTIGGVFVACKIVERLCK